MTTNEELDLKSDMCRNMGARIFFAERALRSIALNHAEAARSGVTEALNALNGILPGSPAPAEPSGNTGELPVCSMCLGSKWIKCATCDGTGNFYRHDEDGDFLSCDDCYDKYGGDRAGTVPCPDCSAAQPATEQPRIWRVMWQSGIAGSRYCESKPNADMAYNYAAYLRSRTAPANDIRVQFSTDNGETWVDEQAGQEGES